MTRCSVAFWFIGLHVGAEFVHSAGQLDVVADQRRVVRWWKPPPTSSATDAAGVVPRGDAAVASAGPERSMARMLLRAHAANWKLQQEHSARCKGKCAAAEERLFMREQSTRARSLDVQLEEYDEVVPSLRELQCERRSIAWHSEAGSCRMSDRFMLTQDRERYLNLHLDAAVSRASKYKARCWHVIQRKLVEVCKRKLQQVIHALMFITQARDYLQGVHEFTREDKQKIEYVQQVLARDDEYITKLQKEPSQKTLDHPMLAAQNTLSLIFQLQNDDERGKAIARINELGIEPTEAEIAEEAEFVIHKRSREWTEETKHFIAAVNGMQDKDVLKALSSLGEESTIGKKIGQASPSPAHVGAFHLVEEFDVDDGMPDLWDFSELVAPVEYVALIVAVVVGIFAFNSFVYGVAVLVWAIIVLAVCFVRDRASHGLYAGGHFRKKLSRTWRDRQRRTPEKKDVRSRTLDNRSTSVEPKGCGCGTPDCNAGATARRLKKVLPVVYIGKTVYSTGDSSEAPATGSRESPECNGCNGSEAHRPLDAVVTKRDGVVRRETE